MPPVRRRPPRGPTARGRFAAGRFLTNPEQQLRRIETTQRTILSELTPGQRTSLRGFATRPQRQIVDPAQASSGWTAPGPPVLADISSPKRATIVRVGSGQRGQKIRSGEEPLTPVLRHEIGHQLLASRAVPAERHHGILQPRETARGLRALERPTPPKRPPGFDPVKSRIKQKFARRLGLDF